MLDLYYPEALDWPPKDLIGKMAKRSFDVAHRRFSTDANGTKMNVVIMQRLNNRTGDMEVCHPIKAHFIRELFPLARHSKTFF